MFRLCRGLAVLECSQCVVNIFCANSFHFQTCVVGSTALTSNMYTSHLVFIKMFLYNSQFPDALGDTSK